MKKVCPTMQLTPITCTQMWAKKFKLILKILPTQKNSHKIYTNTENIHFLLKPGLLRWAPFLPPHPQGLCRLHSGELGVGHNMWGGGAYQREGCPWVNSMFCCSVERGRHLVALDGVQGSNKERCSWSLSSLQGSPLPYTPKKILIHTRPLVT